MSDFILGVACGFGAGFFFGLIIIGAVMIGKIRDNYLPGRQDETQE